MKEITHGAHEYRPRFYPFQGLLQQIVVRGDFPGPLHLAAFGFASGALVFVAHYRIVAEPPAHVHGIAALTATAHLLAAGYGIPAFANGIGPVGPFDVGAHGLVSLMNKNQVIYRVILDEEEEVIFCYFFH